MPRLVVKAAGNCGLRMGERGFETRAGQRNGYREEGRSIGPQDGGRKEPRYTTMARAAKDLERENDA